MPSPGCSGAFEPTMISPGNSPSASGRRSAAMPERDVQSNRDRMLTHISLRGGPDADSQGSAI
jgi:hypothetical protein